LSMLGEGPAEIDRSRRFPDSSLLVSHSNDLHLVVG
jgi:hypothetical protein